MQLTSNMHGPYGYGRLGVYGAVSGKRYGRESFVAAWCDKYLLYAIVNQAEMETNNNWRAAVFML